MRQFSPSHRAKNRCPEWPGAAIITRDMVENQRRTRPGGGVCLHSTCRWLTRPSECAAECTSRTASFISCCVTSSRIRPTSRERCPAPISASPTTVCGALSTHSTSISYAKSANTASSRISSRAHLDAPPLRECVRLLPPDQRRESRPEGPSRSILCGKEDPRGVSFL
jgi:hypothetical protein